MNNKMELLREVLRYEEEALKILENSDPRYRNSSIIKHAQSRVEALRQSIEDTELLDWADTVYRHPVRDTFKNIRMLMDKHVS